MSDQPRIGTPDHVGPWLNDPVHRAFLAHDAEAQLGFFRASLRGDGGFDVLDHAGQAIPDRPQELHVTTRLVHSYALARLWGASECDDIVDAGLSFLMERHRDPQHGGYLWSVGDGGDATKLAYGHVFVLLAGASARMIGHPLADRLIADVAAVIDAHFWDEAAGMLRDEFNRDWTPFSTYRGFNANMHGTEAFLAAYEATGEAVYLQRAGRILEFLVGRIAPAHGWRLPEHYREDWQPDLAYQGNPMFRPRGTTPGHSFELGRLLIQHWDLSGRPEGRAPADARRLIEQALVDAWLPQGGFAYTLDYGGGIGVSDRYWWPVTEAIGALSALIKLGGTEADEAWYRKLWGFACDHFIDHDRGAWYPEIDSAGLPTERQFIGKPDIYHALQADLFALSPRVSRIVASA